MRQLWAVVDFMRGLRRRLRYGKLSRAPICLTCLLWEGEVIHCDWLARLPDHWDSHLPQRVRDANASMQALEDAIAVQILVLESFREVQAAELRIFRRAASGRLELIITGRVNRDTPPQSDISSPVLRAKLSGFQFWLDDGVLEALNEETMAEANF